MPHIPIRTCLGCGIKKSKYELRRFSVDEMQTLVLNSQGSMKGRGVYCCKESSCIKRFFKKRRKIAKALRINDIQLNEELKGLFGSE